MAKSVRKAARRAAKKSARKRVGKSKTAGKKRPASKAVARKTASRPLKAKPPVKRKPIRRAIKPAKRKTAPVGAAPLWSPSVPSMFRRARIGLFGGSFNPAHSGHLNVSRDALRRLRLDEVWWLVSPQNPLKSADGMANLDARMTAARRIAVDPRVRVTCIERAYGTRYTVDTLHRLAREYPRLRFAWLMGADNLAQIPSWRGWTQIFHAVSVAVFARPPYSMRALAGAAAGRFARDRRPMREASSLLGKSPPAWVFLHSKLDPASASAIRARRSA